MSNQNPINIVRFKWKIQDFYEITSIEKCALLISEEFHFNHYKKLLFQLEFCPLNLDTRTHSSVYIRSRPVGKEVQQDLECYFWVENSDGDYVEYSKPCKWSLNSKQLMAGHGDFALYSTLYKPNDQFSLNDDGVLFVCCEVYFLEWSVIGDAFETVSDKVYEGCVVRTGDEKFHFKNELLCKNETFKRMITSPNFTGVVEIPDMRPEIASIMLNFICYNTKVITPNLLDGVFVAATEFSIDELRLICLSHICKNITKRNVFRYLVIGFRYNDEELEKFCLNFIGKNVEQEEFEELSRKPRWSNFFHYDEVELKETVTEAILEVLIK